jgi:hypothetical protein
METARFSLNIGVSRIDRNNVAQEFLSRRSCRVLYVTNRRCDQLSLLTIVFPPTGRANPASDSRLSGMQSPGLPPASL